jgi:hypothetical protein
MSQPLALPNYSSLGRIVTDDLSRYDAMNAATSHGFKYLGDGAACNVYLSPCGTRVLKLATADNGQRCTIDAALAHPDNPHLPRVYGFLDLADGGFAVETELLEDGHGEHGAWSRTWSAGNGATVRPELPVNIAGAPECAMKDALKALHAHAQNYPGIGWDCHAGNIMVRPGTGEVVLNDLLYGGDGTASCERCGGHFDRYNEGEFIDGELWCGGCVEDHAIFCEHAEEHVAASEDDVPFIRADIFFWLRDKPWRVREGRVAGHNRAAFEEAGNVWDEAGQRFVEPNLYAVLSAIQGIAQEALAQHIEPRLPFARAA